ncbi:hypothetical protein F443_00558 [Phytophthora nicotianae P1569]|uniref:Uncharacterized protein n=1 Tax=Phytophthora nicotianae P1569 TaxID=1317065 RepID=V9G202_PHYNI|nr:hypothetical protein F443_00558 [Phytophthora nicotianae P1569]
MQSLFADEDLAGDDVADGDEDLVDEEGLIVDEGRLQTVVADQEARNMSRLLKRFYRTFFIHSSSHDWRFIKAVPGTIETPPRRDFASVPEGANAMDVTALAGSIIVATEDGTCFYVYGWDHNVALR